MIYVVMGLGFISIFLFVLALLTSNLLLKIGIYILSSMQVIIMLYLIWQNSLGNSITQLLEINFKMLFIIWGAATLIGIFMAMYHLVNVDSDMAEVGNDKWLEAPGAGGKWRD